jgi:hypothetical protein
VCIPESYVHAICGCFKWTAILLPTKQANRHHVTADRLRKRGVHKCSLPDFLPLPSRDVTLPAQFLGPTTACLINLLQVIDLALERITERLRAELKLELQVCVWVCGCVGVCVYVCVCERGGEEG